MNDKDMQVFFTIYDSSSHSSSQDVFRPLFSFAYHLR